jgi:hypothetical protein
MRKTLLGPTVPHWMLPLSALLALLLGAQPAWAALGENAASVATDQTRLLARARILRAASHTMHELEVPTGTTVREYLNPGGTVFAVSWQGPFRPDLRQLLGSYYETYLTAAGPRAARGGPINLRLPGLIIHMGGHQRAFYGRAYLIDQLPEGLTPDEIR